MGPYPTKYRRNRHTRDPLKCLDHQTAFRVHNFLNAKVNQPQDTKESGFLAAMLTGTWVLPPFWITYKEQKAGFQPTQI